MQQQQNPKYKKFTHNRMKACLERNDHEDKQNRAYPQDFRNKKFSVQLPSKCHDLNELNQKSIFNQQISVTLNTSNTRCNTIDRDVITIDIKTLTHSLSKQRDERLSVGEILASTDVKSIEVKFMIERLLNCLRNQDRRHNSSMISQKQIDYSYHTELSETQMRPYIQREIDFLQKNYEKLLRQKDNYVSISSSSVDQKVKTLSFLRQQHERQMKQLSEFL